MGKIRKILYVYKEIKPFVKHPSIDISTGDGSIATYLDIKEVTEYDKERLDNLKGNGFNPKFLDLNNFPYDIGKYDFISLDHVITYVDEPDMVLEELSKHLNLDGILLLGVNFGTNGHYKLFRQKHIYEFNSFVCLIYSCDFKIIKEFINVPLNLNFLSFIFKPFLKQRWYILKKVGG